MIKYLAAVAIVDLAAAFVSWEPNPGMWNQEFRSLTVLFAAWFMFMTWVIDREY